MNLKDALDMSREDYAKEYEERNGYNDDFCYNHPVSTQEGYWSYLSSGSDLLLNDDEKLVKMILQGEKKGANKTD